MANDRVKEITARLQAAQNGFERTLAGIPPDAFHRSPKEGEWSAAQVVAHVCESSLFLAGNARRMTQEDKPFIGRDEAAMQARDRALAERSGDSKEEAQRRVRECNAEALRIVSGLSDEGLGRTGQHPRMGEPTVERILNMIVSHLEDHINQMAEAARS